MEPKVDTERELVQGCMHALCQAAGFANPANMAQRDFEFLCDAIYTKTGILISLSTAKRLVNGQFSRLPQTATLNAIAMFLGYENWQAYKFGQKPRAVTTIAQQAAGQGQVTLSAQMRPHKFAYKKLLLFTGLSVLAALVLLAIMGNNTSLPRNIDKAQFSAKKVTNNDIPNTVVFKYNIDSVNADSFFIQQSWDRNRRVRVYKHNYTLTDIYYEPGYHTAKLFANDKIIKTVDVSIPTRGDASKLI